ncbi:NAD(P)-dependent alcohol dehydrogenase [soil metagenome]
MAGDTGSKLASVKVAWRDDYGSPDVVYVRELPKPTPAAGEVLVRVKASSINRADLDGLYPRWGFIKLFLGLRGPREKYKPLGIDLAGTVESVGDGVTAFRPGDDVFGDISAFGSGALAEYACQPEKAFSVMPSGLTFEEAACLGHSGVLAVRGFRKRGGRTVSPADRVLIVGASGNVGPYCIQIAKSLGAHVTAVASGEKLDFVRALGADETIDYRATDYTRPAQPYDWIVEVDAHYPVRRWLSALNKGGVHMAFGGPASWLLTSSIMGPLLSQLTGKHVGVAYVSPFGERDVARLKEYVEAGVLKPVIDRSFSLDEVADALRYVDQGKARGKVVVTPAPAS